MSGSTFVKCVNVVRLKQGPRNQYKVIEADLEDNTDWPSVGEVTMATQNGGNVVLQ